MHTFGYHVHPHSTTSVTTEPYVGIFPANVQWIPCSLTNLIDLHPQNHSFVSKSFDLESNHPTIVNKDHILMDLLNMIWSKRWAKLALVPNDPGTCSIPPALSLHITKRRSINSTHFPGKFVAERKEKKKLSSSIPVTTPTVLCFPFILFLLCCFTNINYFINY